MDEAEAKLKKNGEKSKGKDGIEDAAVKLLQMFNTSWEVLCKYKNETASPQKGMIRRMNFDFERVYLRELKTMFDKFIKAKSETSPNTLSVSTILESELQYGVYKGQKLGSLTKSGVREVIKDMEKTWYSTEAYKLNIKHTNEWSRSDDSGFATLEKGKLKTSKPRQIRSPVEELTERPKKFGSIARRGTSSREHSPLSEVSELSQSSKPKSPSLATPPEMRKGKHMSSIEIPGKGNRNQHSVLPSLQKKRSPSPLMRATDAASYSPESTRNGIVDSEPSIATTKRSEVKKSSRRHFLSKIIRRDEEDFDASNSMNGSMTARENSNGKSSEGLEREKKENNNHHEDDTKDKKTDDKSEDAHKKKKKGRRHTFRKWRRSLEFGIADKDEKSGSSDAPALKIISAESTIVNSTIDEDEKSYETETDSASESGGSGIRSNPNASRDTLSEAPLSIVFDPKDFVHPCPAPDNTEPTITESAPVPLPVHGSHSGRQRTLSAAQKHNLAAARATLIAGPAPAPKSNSSIVSNSEPTTPSTTPPQSSSALLQPSKDASSHHHLHVPRSVLPSFLSGFTSSEGRTRSHTLSHPARPTFQENVEYNPPPKLKNSGSKIECQAEGSPTINSIDLVRIEIKKHHMLSSAKPSQTSVHVKLTLSHLLIINSSTSSTEPWPLSAMEKIEPFTNSYNLPFGYTLKFGYFNPSGSKSSESLPTPPSNNQSNSSSKDGSPNVQPPQIIISPGTNITTAQTDDFKRFIIQLNSLCVHNHNSSSAFASISSAGLTSYLIHLSTRPFLASSERDNSLRHLYLQPLLAFPHSTTPFILSSTLYTFTSSPTSSLLPGILFTRTLNNNNKTEEEETKRLEKLVFNWEGNSLRKAGSGGGRRTPHVEWDGVFLSCYKGGEAPQDDWLILKARKEEGGWKEEIGEWKSGETGEEWKWQTEFNKETNLGLELALDVISQGLKMLCTFEGEETWKERVENLTSSVLMSTPIISCSALNEPIQNPLHKQ
eukprot:TRINITY_DN4675_c0_g1_i1.p1 TRINITY_DN4675_c0_g1~~TRINITY_DN4675_c0_g1_i1.p1  ORF type:complete len:1002 (-),score=219.21 TRINITY_DN4675_c0_g1_i1:21-3026(-)